MCVSVGVCECRAYRVDGRSVVSVMGGPAHSLPLAAVPRICVIRRHSLFFRYFGSLTLAQKHLVTWGCGSVPDVRHPSTMLARHLAADNCCTGSSLQDAGDGRFPRINNGRSVRQRNRKRDKRETTLTPSSDDQPKLFKTCVFAHSTNLNVHTQTKNYKYNHKSWFVLKVMSISRFRARVTTYPRIVDITGRWTHCPTCIRLSDTVRGLVICF